MTSHKYTSIVKNSPTSMKMMIILKLQMSKKFLACDFKLQPFHLHDAICCNINKKSLQLSNSVELLVYFCKSSDYRFQVYAVEMIRTLQSLCEKSWCPSESKVFIYSFEAIWHRHKKVQGLSTYPSSTVSTFDEHLMLLGMNFMAHSAVWGHPPIQRQNTNSKS